MMPSQAFSICRILVSVQTFSSLYFGKINEDGMERSSYEYPAAWTCNRLILKDWPNTKKRHVQGAYGQAWNPTTPPEDVQGFLTEWKAESTMQPVRLLS